MIAKTILGRGIKGAALYVLCDKGREQRQQLGERVSAVAGQGLGFDVRDRATADLAWRVMCSQALMGEELKRQNGISAGGRKAERMAAHLVVSYAEGQTPTDEQAIGRAREAIAAVGMGEAQALFAVHRDTVRVHVHVVANRVMNDGRMAGLSNSRLALSRWCEDVERQEGRIRCEARVENNRRRDTGEPIGGAYVKHRSMESRMALVAKDREIEGGKDFVAWGVTVKEIAGPALWQAHSREDADQRLTTLGLYLQPAEKGGFIVTDGRWTMKLSAVAASLPKLEKAWTSNASQVKRPDQARQADKLGVVNYAAERGLRPELPACILARRDRGVADKPRTLVMLNKIPTVGKMPSLAIGGEMARQKVQEAIPAPTREMVEAQEAGRLDAAFAVATKARARAIVAGQKVPPLEEFFAEVKAATAKAVAQETEATKRAEVRNNKVLPIKTFRVAPPTIVAATRAKSPLQDKIKQIQEFKGLPSERNGLLKQLAELVKVTPAGVIRGLPKAQGKIVAASVKIHLGHER